MPTYEYRRDDGTTFEFFQRISDEPLTTDPETGQPVERVISGGAGLQFKGSGFYLTDYAQADKNSTPKTSDSEKGGTEPSAASKGDTNGSTETSDKKEAQTD